MEDHFWVAFGGCFLLLWVRPPESLLSYFLAYLTFSGFGPRETFGPSEALVSEVSKRGCQRLRACFCTLLPMPPWGEGGHISGELFSCFWGFFRSCKNYQCSTEGEICHNKIKQNLWYFLGKLLHQYCFTGVRTPDAAAPVVVTKF